MYILVITKNFTMIGITTSEVTADIAVSVVHCINVLSKILCSRIGALAGSSIPMVSCIVCPFVTVILMHMHLITAGNKNKCD